MLFIRDQCDCGAFQPDVVHDRAQFCVVSSVARVEYRYFYTVKARIFDRLQNRHIIFRDMTGPQEKVDSNFHYLFCLSFKQPHRAENEKQHHRDNRYRLETLFGGIG